MSILPPIFRKGELPSCITKYLHMTKKLYITSAAIFISMLVLYILTLHPFFPLGDSGEFVVVAKTTGVAHPPGFPLYTLLSFFFSRIPFGNLITRLNLLSAIFGSLAATTTFLLVYRLTKNYIASIISGFVLAFSHLFVNSLL